MNFIKIRTKMLLRPIGPAFPGNIQKPAVCCDTELEKSILSYSKSLTFTSDSVAIFY